LLCSWKIHIYNCDREAGMQEHCVLSKFKCRLTALESWCVHWNIKVNEGKIPAISLEDANCLRINFKLTDIP
jgi:hypothetical protein